METHIKVNLWQGFFMVKEFTSLSLMVSPTKVSFIRVNNTDSVI